MNSKFVFQALFVCGFLAISFLVVRTFMDQNKKNFITPLAEGFIKRVEAKGSPIPKKSLAPIIESALQDAPGTFSIYIKNLRTNEIYEKDTHRSYAAASLYKLWVMGETIRQVEKTELDLDDMLSQDIATLNQKFGIASESAELTDGGITMSVKEALNQMITISHNYAALLLSEKIKLSNVKIFIDTNRFTQSNIGNPPVTTAADIGLLLERLYKGQLGSAQSTDLMIELLKKQQVNHKLPKLLPQNTIVAHKTGELDTVSHDAGIVYLPQGDYIIVVMSESDTRKLAEERIAQISKVVYDYFSH